MRWRFTLSHDVVGTREITEPDGWKDSEIIIERHPDFHSLIERYEGGANGAFIFYGSDGIDIDGGIDFIKEVERDHGIDAEVTFLAEWAPDDVTFSTVYNGLLDLSTIQELTKNRLQCAVIPNDSWSKLINRLDTPVDLSSTTDLDGNTIPAVTPVLLNMVSQKLLQQFDGNSETPGSTSENTNVISNGTYYQMSFNVIELDEINEINKNHPQVDNPELPAPWLVAEYPGSYSFEIQTVAHDYDPAFNFIGTDISDYIQFYINIDGTETPFTVGSLFTSINIDGGRIYTLTHSATLLEGSEVRIYGKAIADLNAGGGGYTGEIRWNGKVTGATVGVDTVDIECYCRITANTTYQDTEAYGYLIHDAFAGVIQRICGVSFYSDLLGATFTNSRTYPSDGCYWRFILLKGLQIRQYTLAEKPFFVSLKQLWEGINPILNLGLGYETTGDSPGGFTIRVEEKAHFYNETKSVSFYDIYQMSRSYDKDHIFKSVKIGYKKWQSEDIAGIDDPQAKRVYITRLQRTGKEITIESEFIGASLAIETCRRKLKEKSADYKHDNDIFIVSVQDPVTPDEYTPELDEICAVVPVLLDPKVGNINNPDARYNLRLIPGFALYRWRNYLQGCLQAYPTSQFKFASGEGNYDMVITIDTNDCDDDVIETNTNFGSGIGAFGSVHSEKHPIEVTDNYLFIPTEFKKEFALEFENLETIRENLKHAIGISQTTTDAKAFFIKKLTYKITEGQVAIESWPKEYFEMQVIEGDYAMPGCARNFDDGGAPDPEPEPDQDYLLHPSGFYVLHPDGSRIILG
jgi:hypothetical protein